MRRPLRVTAVIPDARRAYSGCITNLEPERLTMFNAIDRPHRRPARLAASLATRVSALSVAALSAILLASGTAGAQSAPRAAALPAQPPAQVSARATTLRSAPDLQGLWDFTMRVGERTSPGFLALGPVERGWAGSITMYLTNTLAIRAFTVDGDSVRMVVASRDGDVRFVARLSDDARTLEGIVEYHGGARLPMTAVRRAQPALPR